MNFATMFKAIASIGQIAAAVGGVVASIPNPTWQNVGFTLLAALSGLHSATSAGVTDHKKT